MCDVIIELNSFKAREKSDKEEDTKNSDTVANRGDK